MKSLKKLVGVFVFVLLAMLMLSNNVLAESIDEVISTKEVTIKSIPITDMMAYYQVNELFGEMYNGYGIDNCNDDYTVCDIVHYGTDVVAEKVKLNYVYDKDVKTVVDNIMKKIPEDGKIFYLNDIETIKFIRDLANYEGEEELNPIRYSSEYKKFIEYNNFIFEPRMGYDEDFASFRGGTASFKYNDTIYGYADGIGVRFNLVLYVKDNETDIEGSLKKRLSKYFDIVDVTKIEEQTVEEMLNGYIEYYENNYNFCKTELAEVEAVPNEERDSNYFSRWSDVSSRCHFVTEYDTADEYVETMEYYMFEEENAELDFVGDVEDYLYGVEFADGMMMQFMVIKDSSKVFEAELENVNTDTSSGVTISTSGVIPLDTLIEVARLTDGEEYEKIVKILKATDVEMFDLKLFSKSTDKYITKLDDGKFEVKLPISDNFKGKNLIVYYVNASDEVEEYEVTVKDGYAVFNTDHFSIYTLAENPNATSSSSTTNNPQTADKLLIYVSILFISLIGLASLLVYLKKKFIKNN